jgi:hypothetical protein
MCKSDEKMCVYEKLATFLFVVVTITLSEPSKSSEVLKMCKIKFFRNNKNRVGLLGFAAAGAFFYVEITKSRGYFGICCRRRLFYVQIPQSRGSSGICCRRRIFRHILQQKHVFGGLLMPQAPFFGGEILQKKYKQIYKMK